MGLATPPRLETLVRADGVSPCLHEVRDPDERDRAANRAWRRFSWINLASHGAVAARWATGRAMLSGREVSARARSLARTKDVLVGVSLATCVAGLLLGRTLGRRTQAGRGPEQARDTNGHETAEMARSRRLDRAVNTVSAINLASNAAVVAVTTMLSAEASGSVRFAGTSRRLP